VYIAHSHFGPMWVPSSGDWWNPRMFQHLLSINKGNGRSIGLKRGCATWKISALASSCFVSLVCRRIVSREYFVGIRMRTLLYSTLLHINTGSQGTCQDIRLDGFPLSVPCLTLPPCRWLIRTVRFEVKTREGAMCDSIISSYLFFPLYRFIKE
jgi:hypothetical protein